jgi:large subunit ribosomal protein L28
MSRVCYFTGRRTRSGWTKAEKGATRDGGVGNKIKGRTKRMVKPNLKKIKAMVDGEAKFIYVSTRALKSGLVIKPSRVKKPAAAAATPIAPTKTTKTK